MLLHKENQVKYTVKYKPAGKLFFRTIRNVVGDVKLDQTSKSAKGTPEPWPIPIRLLILKDGARVEIPMVGTVFKFSKKREQIIKDNINKEAGSKII